jgi:NAD(P)-dependent dehydrogenase (short-subunit alcohol dehydrogenase family)
MTLAIDLAGRHAFVQGAGAGIGGACVRTLAAAGARVSCFDVDAEVARAAAAPLGNDGIALHGDATRFDDVRDAVARATDALGPIDIAVDVIGVAQWGHTVELDDTAWDASFDLVLRHFFHLARAAGAPMAERGSGAIVCIASVSGLRSAPRHGPYGAAKAGLMALVRTLAIELAERNVRVNAVAPGAVLTPRVVELISEEGRAESASSIPLRRYATPEEIAAAVVFLASDLASYVTGQTLVVDGGATAQFPLSLRA